ncbi:hypothetical protein [Maricaulis sp.]|uniref:hypothetical protein n=1 Tax=Maricaulis sp. TaxID=1486257 RepID=UPI0026300964|nr:hypothetical protein [Maricaulis sp.]
MIKKPVGALIGGAIGVLVIPVFFGLFIYFVADRNPLPILMSLAAQPFVLVIAASFGLFGAFIGGNPGSGKGDGSGGGGFIDGGGDFGGGGGDCGGG